MTKDKKYTRFDMTYTQKAIDLIENSIPDRLLECYECGISGIVDDEVKMINDDWALCEECVSKHELYFCRSCKGRYTYDDMCDAEDPKDGLCDHCFSDRYEDKY